MSLKVQLLESIDEINENQWNNVVTQSGSGTVYHRVGWLRAIETGLDRDPKHVVVRKNGNPVAICPNFVSPIELPVTLPLDPSKLGLRRLFSLDPGFGGPLICTNRERSLEAIFGTIDGICNGTHISHRMRILDADHVQYAQTLRELDYRPSLSSCRFWLELDDYQRILDGMDKERRKEIRDAKASDPVIEEEDISRRSIREFHAEYTETVNQVGGTPFPLTFFDALCVNLEDRIHIFTAYIDGQPAGRHLYLGDEEQDSLHYLYSGVPKRYFEHSSPSLLHDYAFQWGIENDYGVFDFGRTSADFTNGTFRYKNKYGAHLEPVYEWEKSGSPLRWRLYRSARKLYHRYGGASED